MPNGSRITVMHSTPPMMSITSPKRTAINRPVKLTIHVKNRQIAQNGHKYQGTGSDFVI
jgi:hypothetical protein